MLWSPNLPPFGNHIRRRGKAPPGADYDEPIRFGLKWGFIGGGFLIAIVLLLTKCNTQ